MTQGDDFRRVCEWLQRFSQDPAHAPKAPLTTFLRLWGDPWLGELVRSWPAEQGLATGLWVAFKHLERYAELLDTLPSDLPPALRKRWQVNLQAWHRVRLAMFQQALLRYQQSWRLSPRDPIEQWIDGLDRAWRSAERRPQVQQLAREFVALGLDSSGYCRPAPPPPSPLRWRQNPQTLCRLSLGDLLYFPAHSGQGRHKPVLLVYALLNSPAILDLDEQNSLILSLTRAGVPVYLIAWHAAEQCAQAGLKDYTISIISEAVSKICTHSDVSALRLMGVCQGGVLALIYAALRPREIERVVTLVTPVDHSKLEGGMLASVRGVERRAWQGLQRPVPGAWLGAFLDEMSPFQSARAYVKSVLKGDAESQALYRKMEAWRLQVFDQPPTLMREYAEWVMQHNGLMQARDLGGLRVCLSQIPVPVLHVCARYDRLVPYDSAIALRHRLPRAQLRLLCVDSGHIGAFVSEREGRRVREAVVEWLAEV